MSRSKLNSKQVLLCAGTTNYKCNVVWRTSCSTEALHFFYKEWDEGTWVLDACFGLLVEICLIGRTTTFGYTEEVILHTFSSFQVNLCGEVTFGVHFVVHIEWSILRVTEVTLSVCEIYTLGECLFIAIASPDLLTFLAMDDSSAGILTEWQLTFARYFRVAQESEGYIFVVGTSLWITENFSYLLIVTTTEHKTHI